MLDRHGLAVSSFAFLALILLVGMPNAPGQLPKAPATPSRHVLLSWSPPMATGNAFRMTVERNLSGCGASLAVASVPRFHLANGTFTFVANVSAAACGNVTSTATYYEKVGVRNLTFTVATSGWYNCTCLAPHRAL
jgi:hypothetical protein